MYQCNSIDWILYSHRMRTALTSHKYQYFSSIRLCVFFNKLPCQNEAYIDAPGTQHPFSRHLPGLPRLNASDLKVLELLEDLPNAMVGWFGKRNWHPDIFGSSHDFQVLYFCQVIESEHKKLKRELLKTMRSGIHRRSCSDWFSILWKIGHSQNSLESCTRFVAQSPKPLNKEKGLV